MFTQEAIRRVIRDIRGRRISNRQAWLRLKNLPYETLSIAKLDHHRQIRKGFPEAVYAPGKSIDQLRKIISSMAKVHRNFVITRVSEGTFLSLRGSFPELIFSKPGRIAYLKESRARNKLGPVVIITAGTADIPVAEEAAVTLELMSIRVKRLFDCGVAGLQRLFDQLPKLRRAKAIICIAGMEGALPSVLAGLVDKPVVAVPTSAGYGANFKGIAPLLTMLNCCAPGVAVVNIDNGYGAACFVKQILELRK